MKRLRIKINEDQFNMLEKNMNDNFLDVKKSLEAIECTGEDLKLHVENILKGYEYNNIIINFLGHFGEKKDLMYVVYTEGPIITYKAKSEIRDKPCLTIFDIKIYKEI